MLRNENRVEINRPPAEVFKFIAELSNEPRYVPNVLESEKISDGPTGVGTKYREVTRVMLGRKAVATYEITQYDPPTTFAFRGTSGRSRFRGRWVLEATDGGTLAKFTAEAQLAWPTKYLERFVRGSVAATFAVMGRNLKLVLTAPPASKRRGAGAKAVDTTSAAAGDGAAAGSAAGKRQSAGGAPRRTPAKGQAAKRQPQAQSRSQSNGPSQNAGAAPAKRSSRSRKPSTAKKPNAADGAGDGAGGGATGADDAGG
ncbi:MAG: SRPBCC family protein [Candidatus Dormibacteraeota bacterium]|nr:SRPBCC family protein [Candidatus Dormibacteraeota bacterium]